MKAESLTVGDLGRDGRFQEGIVLLMVLWILVLLTVIVGQFCYTMRSEVRLTRNDLDGARAYYLARAGINLAIAKILDGTVTDQFSSTSAETEGFPQWRVNAPISPIPFGGGLLQVKIDNESGKFNINEADVLQLKMLIKPFDIPGRQEDTIVQSILDWRDMDNFHRNYGAENDYYQSLAEPYSCNNGPFRSVEELLKVRGVTRELWDQGLRDMVTIHNDLAALGSVASDEAVIENRKINVNAASAAVLRCFPKMTEEKIEQIFEYRRTRDFLSTNQFQHIVGRETFQEVYRYITVNNSSYYMVQATGSLPDSPVQATVKALVKIGYRRHDYKILQWLDYVEPPRLPAAAEEPPGDN